MEALSNPTDVENAATLVPANYMSDEIRALISKVSNTIPSSISIRTPAEYSGVQQAWDGEKALLKEIETSFAGTESAPGPKALAFRTWKSICSLENKLTEPVCQRIDLYGKALAAFDDAREAEAQIESQRLALEAAAEDQNRREAEAAFLTKRADVERRPDLAEKATQILDERRPLPSPAVDRGVPASPGMRFGVEHIPECDNLEALVMAIAKPRLLRDVAKTLRDSITSAEGKKLSAARKEERRLLVDILERAAGDAVQIPVEAVCMDDSFVKKIAKNMSSTVAKWPGITLTRDKKPKKVGRRS